MLGIDKMTVSRIERGLSNFSIGTLERLAKSLDVPVQDLLKS
jgi:transcriptional regulator with XRE-family HTH domain